MLISTNPIPEKEVFEEILDKVLLMLKEESQNDETELLKLKGTKLEEKILELLITASKNTEFENSIELISGQRFPDIVAKKLYGVEVKTTDRNAWTTTGGSIMEGTRVDDVDRIYLLFGKLHSPVEFMCRTYEDCLSDIAVTHSPRYLIDMQLPVGDSIFDKIGVNYDTLRRNENPISFFKNYYISRLRPGQSVWWLEQGINTTSEIVTRMWSYLDPKEKKAVISKALILYPEIIGNSSSKYSKLSLWLTNEEGIICPNIRDAFTAGGKVTINFKEKEYNKIPKIIFNILESIDDILELLEEYDTNYLHKTWSEQNELQDIKYVDSNKISVWIDLVISFASKLNLNGLPLHELINEKKTNWLKQKNISHITSRL